jgi:hypothetical protein
LKLIIARFDSMDKRFDSLEARFDSMDGRLTAVEEKVDRRLQETRPIWERVLAELAELRRELGQGLRRVERHVDILNHDLLEVRGDLRHLDERVTKLEPETP